MKQNSVIEFNNVYRNYQKKQVLNGITFSVATHEIVALLGVNGAGKTTTIKMLLGEERPNKGQIYINGKNPIDPHSRKAVGSTPQNIEFPEGLKTKEILQFVHNHYTNPCSVKEITNKFNLHSILERKAAKLSSGQKRLLAIALAFIGNPDVIFLDEPTTGLDVESRLALWEIVKNYAKLGKSIFLTTHYLEEIEQIATRILFLHNGYIKVDGSIDEVKKGAASVLTQIIFNCDDNLSFAEFSQVESIEHEGNRYKLSTLNSDALLRELVEKNVQFSNLQILKENLESAFLKLAKEYNK